jgi:hypothetical protein
VLRELTGQDESVWEHVQIDLQEWVGMTVTLRLEHPAATHSGATIDDVSVGSAFPDLWVNQSGLPSAQEGEMATLELEYGNRSSLPAPATVLGYTLPAGVSYVSAAPEPVSTDPMTWELGDLAAEITSTIELTVAVDVTATRGVTLSAPATIATPHEAILGNNSTEFGIWVGNRVYLPVLTRG